MATSAAAAKLGLTKAVTACVASATGPVRRKIKNWNAENRIEKIYKHIREVRKVKTIWSMDRAIDLMDFYYPASVVNHQQDIFSKDSLGHNVKYIHDIGSDNVIVEGTVGQGKSIFFRYLTSQEMYLGQRVPVFFELRRLGEENLRDRVGEVLANFDVSSDRDVQDHILKSGCAVVLLDGFDEVSDKQKAYVLDQIDRFSEKYKKCQILISTRPGSIVSTLPKFLTVSLAKYDSKQLPKVVAKLAKSPDIADALISEIAKSASNLSTLLTTPLMVTLLVVKYSRTKQFPETAAEFFENLFDVLLVTHDNTKLGGVDRDRKCDVSERVMRRVFDTVCFMSRYDGVASFTKDKLTEYVQISIQKNAMDLAPDDYISDIEKVTCLLLMEGVEYKYVHKSVQEYHSACYIRDMEDVLASRFYSRMVNNHAKWPVELGFLETIDERRFYAEFGLEQLQILLPEGSGVNKYAFRLKQVADHVVAGIRLVSLPDSKQVRIRYKLASKNYYLPDVEFFSHGPSDYWEMICEYAGSNPAKKKYFRQSEIIDNVDLMKYYENNINSFLAVIHKNLADSLPVKLKRALDLKQTRSVVRGNPFV